MKITTALISAAAATVIGSTGMLIASAPNDVAVKPSPGVTAEQLLDVTQAGRTNIHSDGRAGGKALPRHGGQGGAHTGFGRHGIHKVDYNTPGTDEQFVDVEPRFQLTAAQGHYTPGPKRRFGPGVGRAAGK